MNSEGEKVRTAQSLPRQNTVIMGSRHKAGNDEEIMVA
jgi:hypothetical protein